MKIADRNKSAWHQLSLKELIASWAVCLGVLLWGLSLFFPAGIKGEGTEIGLHYFVCSILVTLSPPALLEDMVVFMSVVAVILHVLMMVGIVLWIRKSGRVRGLVRTISLLLIAGAVTFKLEESLLFDSSKVGFQLWVCSFICVGVGLFVFSITLVSPVPPEDSIRDAGQVE